MYYEFFMSWKVWAFIGINTAKTKYAIKIPLSMAAPFSSCIMFQSITGNL